MAGARSALIVESARYADPELRQLRAPGSDVEALATVLRDPDIGGFDVRVLLDQPAHGIVLAVYFATTNTRLRRFGATAVAADLSIAG